MIGTYWCPHCRHQKEIFGKEAWVNICYIEAAPRGFNYDPKAIQNLHVPIDGFPTWIIPSLTKEKTIISGEMSLKRLAEATHYKGLLDDSLEDETSYSTVSGTCP